MKSVVRMGFIGAGSIGRVHMRAFAQAEGVQLAGVTDVYREAADRAAAEHGIAEVYDSAEALLRSRSIDAVVIGVPNRWHASLAVLAMRESKDVLLEKPMGIDAAAAEKITDAQRQTGRILMVSHQWRWEWLSMTLREQVEQGRFGRLYAVKAGWFRRKGIPGWGTWFTQKNQSGGGPLIDIGVHLLDLSLWLMGNPRPVSVSGATYAAFGPARRGIGSWGRPDWNGTFDVEDLAMAMVRMEDGSLLTLDVSWAVHMATDNQPFIHLLGTEGGAGWHLSRGRLFTEQDSQATETDIAPPQQDEGSRVRLTAHFLQCVRERVQPLTSVATGLTNNRILDAIYQSSASGKEVTLS